MTEVGRERVTSPANMTMNLLSESNLNKDCLKILKLVEVPEGNENMQRLDEMESN